MSKEKIMPVKLKRRKLFSYLFFFAAYKLVPSVKPVTPGEASSDHSQQLCRLASLTMS